MNHLVLAIESMSHTGLRTAVLVNVSHLAGTVQVLFSLLADATMLPAVIYV